MNQSQIIGLVAFGIVLLAIHTFAILPYFETKTKITTITLQEFCEEKGGEFQKGFGLVYPSCLFQEENKTYQRYGFWNHSSGYCNTDCKLVKSYG